MKKVIPLTILLLFFSNTEYVHPDSETENKVIPVFERKTELNDLLEYWYAINTRIEGEEFLRPERQQALNFLIPLLKDCLLNMYGQELFMGAKVSFPVRGGHIYDVGGVNGSGYRPRHHGHDIFVKDGNYDCLNDVTGEEYFALAMQPAVVLSTYEDWQPGSDLEGGNHVWLYNPAQNIILYYAHLNRILVKPGDFVKEGTPIATIGRTGENAFLGKSPTHVHVMEMKYDGNRLTSYNFYPELVQSARNK